MSLLIMGSSFDLMPFCYKASAGLTWVGMSERFTLASFDWDVVADSLFTRSKPGWNVGSPPVDGSGGESLLHSREIQVPCAVKELVCFVPFFSPVPAGMFDAD